MTRSDLCLHCSSPLPRELAGQPGPPFCCNGCREVFRLLSEQGLARYYDIARGEVAPAPAPAGERSLAWLDPLLENAGAGQVCALDLDVQGVHCAACVWLMGELYRRQGGGSGIVVNPALGKVRLTWKRGFDVRRFVSEVERFGYQFGPSRKTPDGGSRDLVARIGLTAAITMNVMMFSVAFYTGLAPSEGFIFDLFSRLVVALASIAVLVGGWPFLRGAWQALKRGILHLDLPIAMGLLLAYGTSLWQWGWQSGRGDIAYFDTLSVFVLLMLTGRWLQQRVLDRNRRFLLEDDGAADVWVRRRESGSLRLVRAPEIREADELLVAPGDLVPVDAELVSASATFSMDWITGEAEPVRLETGEVVRAGSFLSGSGAATVRARTAFADSPLPQLLRGGASSAGTAHQRFWDRVARRYVVGVLALAALALGIWWPRDPARALEITVSVLVVTCPCAIGIAIPLAYELSLSRLRRAGLFARSPDLLDKLLRVKKVLFDKTGTLTLGHLTLANPAAVAGLSRELRDAAFDMASRSNHPVSRCLSSELARAGATFDPAAEVHEQPGRGMVLSRSGAIYALGRGASGATSLTVNGVEMVRFDIRDEIRRDAHREVAALRDEGLEVWLLSGDRPHKVAHTAVELGVPQQNALASLSPQEKAERVSALDQQDTLYLGDGINDSLAFERAFCAGTPAIDRPVLPGKADFFLLGEGIGALRASLAVAKELRAVVRRNLVLAYAYNLVAVATCLAGAMTPLRAAVAMPISSIVILLLTATSLSGRRSARAVQGAAVIGTAEAH